MSSYGQSYAQGFFSPEDVATEQGLRRRQAYAQALLQGDTPQGAYGGLANAGNKLLGAFLSNKTDAKEADLAKSSQSRYATDMAAFLKGGNGAPAGGQMAPQSPSVPSPQISNAGGPDMPMDEAGMAQGAGPTPQPIPNAQGPSPMPQAIPNAQGPAPAPTPMGLGGPPQPSQPQSPMDRLLATGNPALIQQFAPQLFTHQLGRDDKQADYQRDRNDTVHDKAVTVLSPEEVKQAGFQPGAVVQRDAFGGLHEVQKSDVLSDAAFGQKKTLEQMSQAPQWANIDLAKQRLAMQKSGVLLPEEVDFMADQILAGDKSPFNNIGRGAQGAENIASLRRAVATKARGRGLGGADLAALNAEFAGLQAGERTLGTRTANIEMAASEAQNLMPIALEASRAVNRSQYPSLNKIQLAIQQGTGDQNVVKLGVAVNGLVNTYARAISPTGNPTVSDKDHAREILDKAWSNGQFEAAVGQMQQEIGAARKSPGSVRGEFRNAISGRQGGPASVPDAPSGPSGQPSAPSKVIRYDASGKRL